MQRFRLLSLLGVFCVLSYLPVPYAHTEPSALSPSNYVKFWHFSDNNVQEYSIGDSIYFRVKYQGTDVLWDPVKQHLTKWITSYSSKFKSLSGYNSIVKQEPLRLDADTTIERYIPSSVGATSFTDYYNIASNNKLNGSFLLIARQGKNHFEQRFCCDDTNHAIESLSQVYDSITYVQALRLRSNLVLFLVAAFDASYRVQVYFIAMYAMPESTLGFDRNVYLIPTSLSNRALNNAGQSLRARYAVVSHIIADATEVTLSNPRPLLSSQQFFYNMN